ncbi:hypothetical protein [Acinetobacter brisouii]
MNIYTLFYIQSDKNRIESVNLKNDDRLRVYVDNLFFLSKNLFLKTSNKLNVITNNGEKIVNLNSDIELYCNLIEIDFSTNVPENAKFYSAHFKLDVFRYFSKLPNEFYGGLIDLDVICLGENFKIFNELLEKKESLVYEITEQRLPAYGFDVIKKDISYVLGMESVGKWYGGEFIFGDAIFFKKLIKEIDGIYQNYIKNIDHLSHHGDEVIVSAAIEKLIRNGVSLKSISNNGIIERYWSVYPKHKQRKIEFYLDNFFLHLPADKDFISNNCNLEINSFIKKYKKYVFIRKLKSFIKQKIFS